MSINWHTRAMKHHCIIIDILLFCSKDKEEKLRNMNRKQQQQQNEKSLNKKYLDTRFSSTERAPGDDSFFIILRC